MQVRSSLGENLGCAGLGLAWILASLLYGKALNIWRLRRRDGKLNYPGFIDIREFPIAFWVSLIWPGLFVLVGLGLAGAQTFGW